MTQVPVRVLPPDAARQIVDAATEAAGLPEATLTSILSKGEGNPFFLEELSLALREQGGLEAGQALPDTIQGVIAARIDRLTEPAKRLLQTAAVMGREFPLRLLESVVDSSTNDLAQLDALKQLEFFYQRLEPEGPVYVFKHALTQDVAYESLLTARKEVLHEAVGRAIEAVHPGRLEEHYEMLAHHYSHSRNAEKAIEYLNHANLKAHKANAVADAQAYFNEALRQYGRLVDTPDRKRARIALIARQAPVFMLQMKMVEYEALLRSALADAESTGDEGLLGEFLACLGHCLWFTARYPEAIETNLRAARLAENSGQLDGAGHGLMLVQWSHLYAGSFPDVVKVEPQAISALQRAPNLRYRIWALTASAWAYANMGQWSLAIERCRQTMEEGEAVSDPSIVAFGAWILAISYVQKGELDAAIRYATLSVDKAPTLGDKAWGTNVLLWAMARRAVDNEVITKLDQSWRLFQGTGFKGLIAFAGDVLAEAYLKAGRLEDAEATAEAVNELCEACGQQYWRGVALRLSADARMRRSQDPFQIRLQLELSLRLLGACAAEPDIAHTYAALGRLLTGVGQVGSAREHWNMALQIYQRLQMTPDEQGARAALQQLG